MKECPSKLQKKFYLTIDLSICIWYKLIFLSRSEHEKIVRSELGWFTYL